MWKWNTVCQAAAPQEFSRLTPSAPEALARCARARRCAAAARRAAGPRRATLSRSRAVRARDHERVPARGGRDVHEGDRALVFVDDRAPAARRRRSCRRCSRGRASAHGDGLAARRAARARSASASLARARPRPRTAPRRAPRAARRAAGPGAMPSSRGQLVAAQQRPRRALLRASAARRRASRARAAGARRSPPRARSPARGEAVGDRQQRDVDLDRRAGAQVARTRVRARQRLGLVHEEAEAQVVAHERRDVGAQPLARAQPAEHLARQLGARARRGR